jgi:hypothetical protein
VRALFPSTPLYTVGIFLPPYGFLNDAFKKLYSSLYGGTLLTWNRQDRKRKKLPAAGFESGSCRVSNREPDSHPRAATSKDGRMGSTHAFVVEGSCFGKSQQKLSLPLD